MQWRYLMILGAGIPLLWLLVGCGRLEFSVATPTAALNSEENSDGPIPPAFAQTPTPTNGAVSEEGATTISAAGGTEVAEAPTPEATATSNSFSKDNPTPSRSEKNEGPASEVDDCAVKSEWPAYQVKSGDTLGRLASLSGSTISELSRANCLNDPNQIESGQLLHLPRSIDPTPTPLPTPEPWSRYFDSRYQVSFDYPVQWREVGDGQSIQFRGQDGFVTVVGSGSPYDLDTMAAEEANHRLQPYGSSPTVESFSLPNGFPARLVLPSADQPSEMGGQALLVAPFAEPIQVFGASINYLLLMADQEHVRSIGSSLTMPEPPKTISINEFDVVVTDLTGEGKRLVFTWDTSGANRATIFSGTAQRFMPWWPVEASGQMTVELKTTLFPDPVMSFLALNDITGQEARTSIQIEWPCSQQYFFSPVPERCPAIAPVQVQGAYQPFENGFMIWMPHLDGSLPSIYVFGNDGWLSHFQDTWSEDDPGDPSLTPPDGLFAAVGGFGKVWLANPEVQERLGWGTSKESLYDLKYQVEGRESIPGVSYLTRPDGSVLQLIETSWSLYLSG